MQTVLIILLSIIIIGFLIALHELGHLAFAKLFKVYCFEYAIGMGPKIYSKKGKETTFSLRALPIGGYVSMYGETEDFPDEYAELEIPEERSLLKVAKWKRAFIMSGGILVNFIVAFFIFMIGNTLPYTVINSNVQVIENGVAANLGVKADDIIIAPQKYDDGDEERTYAIFDVVTLNEKEYNVLIYYPDYHDTSLENYFHLIPRDVKKLTNLNQLYTPSEEVSFDVTLTFAKKIEYNEEKEADEYIGQYEVTFPVKTVKAEKGDTYKYEGFDFSLTKQQKRRSFGKVISASGSDWVQSTTAVGRAIITLFTPETFNNIGGVVAIFSQSSSIYANYGWANYIFIWGMISVNLALFNLLPFPGLDGWHLLVVIIEGISRKEISKKFKQVASTVGMIILFTFILFLLVRDIVGFF